MTEVTTDEQINVKWPPTEDQMKNIARSAFKQTTKDNFKVLVYWENNPQLMMIDPIFYANTEYIRNTYKNNMNKTVEVIIGKED